MNWPEFGIILCFVIAGGAIGVGIGGYIYYSYLEWKEKRSR